MAACHSPLSTSATTPGLVDAEPPGKSASATPDASATGSLPLTRVVSRVAPTGNPSCWAAFLLFDLTPDPMGELPPLSLFSEQPQSARIAAAASRGVRRSTAADDIARRGRLGPGQGVGGRLDLLLTDRSGEAVS